MSRNATLRAGTLGASAPGSSSPCYEPRRMSPPVRVRIAPSPTGDPHVGTAYIALFNYAFAKKQRRQVHPCASRTPTATRSTPESEAAILRALSWVGLQLGRGPRHRRPVRPLPPVASAPRSTARTSTPLMAIGRAPTAASARRSGSRPCATSSGARGCSSATTACAAGARATRASGASAAGEPFVVRLAMPRTGETVFVDRLRGEVKFENAQIDDQILLKTDGFPTYHLANVVDDHLMEITHVIRAEEWLSSTPKHVVLYQAFGWQAPEWVHMPLLRNADKSKISKRKNPVSLDYYQDAGFLPEALLNYLGTMGWSIAGDREKFTLDEMVEAFSFDRVSLGGPVFDLVKLSAMNADYLRALRRRRDRAPAARLAPLRRAPARRSCRSCASASSASTSSSRSPTSSSRATSTTRRCRRSGCQGPDAQGGRRMRSVVSARRWTRTATFQRAGLEALARAFAEKTRLADQGAVHAAAPGGHRQARRRRRCSRRWWASGRELVRRRIRLCAEYVKKMPAPAASGAGRALKGGRAGRSVALRRDRSASADDPSRGARRGGRSASTFTSRSAASAARTATSRSTRAPRSRTTSTPTPSSPSSRARARLVRGAGPARVDLLRRRHARPLAAGRARARDRGGPRKRSAVAARRRARDHRRGEPRRDRRRAAARAARGGRQPAVAGRPGPRGSPAGRARAATTTRPRPARRARGAGRRLRGRLRSISIFGVPGQSLDDWRRAVDAALALAPDARVGLRAHHRARHRLRRARPRRPAAAPRRRSGRRDVRARAAPRSPPPGCRVRGVELRAARRVARATIALLGAGAVPRRGRVGGFVPAARRRQRAGASRTRAPPTSTCRRPRAGGGSPAPRHVERRTAADLENEAVWLGLRTTDGIDRAAHRARHGRDPLAGREPASAWAITAGWLVADEAHVRLTPAGVLFADEIAGRFWRDES